MTAAVLAVLLLSGCAWMRGQPPAGDVAHPGGSALVLRVYSTGGFVPADFQLTNLPGFTLLGDGRVIVGGAQASIYPGPVLPSLMVRQLSESGLQAVLRRALESSQLSEDARWQGAGSHVADAPDTVFVLHADDRDVTVRVYALGIVAGGFADMSPDEQRAHTALAELTADLLDLDSWVPSDGWSDADWRPYRADALRLLVWNADGEAPPTDGLPLQLVPWPTPSIDPETFGDPTWDTASRCGVVDGQAAADWNEALASANQLTRWVAGEHRYRIAVRPLMPDEAGDCQPLG